MLAPMVSPRKCNNIKCNICHNKVHNSCNYRGVLLELWLYRSQLAIRLSQILWNTLGIFQSSKVSLYNSRESLTCFSQCFRVGDTDPFQDKWFCAICSSLLAYEGSVRSPNIPNRQFLGFKIFRRNNAVEVKEPMSAQHFWTTGQDQKQCRKSATWPQTLKHSAIP